MSVLFELNDLLGVYFEFADVLIEAKEILAWALKSESLVVVGECISYLLNIVLIWKEMDQLFIYNK